jgi:DNA-binding transcriptional ArsR family regulator
MNQGCLKTTAIVLIVVGVLLALLGLIFLLAPGKAVKGLIMLAVAGVIIGFAASRLKAMAALTPESIEKQLASLAAASGGEITVSEAVGRLGISAELVTAGLQRLQQRGMATIELRDGTEYYAFAGLKETRVTKKCPYCGNEYPVSSGLRTCPSCGGNLEVRPE